MPSDACAAVWMTGSGSTGEIRKGMVQGVHCSNHKDVSDTYQAMIKGSLRKCRLPLFKL